MKILKIFILVFVCILSGTLRAQVSVGVTIGTPPMWGPAGHDDVRYYYLPDVEAYYDLHTSQFIYFGNGVWLHRAYLPWRYSHYDLYAGYKVLMYNYRGERPYTHFKEHKIKYKKGYRGPYEKNVGQSHNKNEQQKNSHKQAEQQHKNTGEQKSQEHHGNGGKETHGGGASHGGGKGKK